MTQRFESMYEVLTLKRRTQFLNHSIHTIACPLHGDTVVKKLSKIEVVKLVEYQNCTKNCQRPFRYFIGYKTH